MEHSFSPGKIFYVERAQDAIDKLTLFEHIDICGFAFHLKALVRCHNKHFTCATRFENKWNFLDDLSYPVICFETLNDITRHYRTVLLSLYFGNQKSGKPLHLRFKDVFDHDHDYINTKEHNHLTTNETCLQHLCSLSQSTVGGQSNDTNTVSNNKMTITKDDLNIKFIKSCPHSGIIKIHSPANYTKDKHKRKDYYYQYYLKRKLDKQQQQNYDSKNPKVEKTQKRKEKITCINIISNVKLKSKNKEILI